MTRTVIVTGASQGIGFETAVGFAQAGDTVVATSRDSGKIVLPDDVRGGRIDAVTLDVTDQAAVDAFAQQVLSDYGTVDVLVNNVGRAITGSTEELSVADVMVSIETNFLSAFRMTKAFLPAMRTAGKGHLIAVTSIGGAVGQPFVDAYCAAKFAVEGLYESLHPVSAACGVAVSIVQPGPVHSDHRNRGLETVPVPAISSLRESYLEMTDKSFEGAQPAADVAAMILAVAGDPQPKLRYQSSRLVERIVGKKLSDLSGESVTKMTAAWLENTSSSRAARPGVSS